MKKILILLPLIFILSMFYAYGLACGFNNPTPASSSTIGNNTMLNASYSNAGTTDPTISIEFSLQSSSLSRNTSLSMIANISNNTAVFGLASINTSFPNSVIMDDAGDYTLSCACYNSTGSSGAKVACNSTRTSMTLDRTVPDLPSAITFTNPLVADDTITATINRGLANSCYVRFGGIGDINRVMTLSGSTCTFTVGIDSPPNSDYNGFIVASDGLNSTLSSIQSITIRARKSDGGGLLGGAVIMDGQAAQSPFIPKTNDKAMLGLAILILAFMYFRSKK